MRIEETHRFARVDTEAAEDLHGLFSLKLQLCAHIKPIQ